MITIPKNYKIKLLPETTEIAIKEIKKCFQSQLTESLNLRRVTAPLLIQGGLGLSDDNSELGRSVTFDASGLPGQCIEIARSLAKWKRLKLAEYDIAPGFGLYTVMKSIRPDIIPDNFRSLYVDQWDWELTIADDERNLQTLKDVAVKIYNAILEAEALIYRHFPHITPTLPRELTFVHSEDLLAMYPGMSAREREAEFTKQHKAVFVIGLGGKLADGAPHELRAPDYDDWSTQYETEQGVRTGLNGDILLWNTVLEAPMEVSSMGIRVDADALRRQLELTGTTDREGLMFHSRLLAGELPDCIGGGIGQSRLAMFLLQKAHIGEVQASVWPEEDLVAARRAGIRIL